MVGERRGRTTGSLSGRNTMDSGDDERGADVEAIVKVVRPFSLCYVTLPSNIRPRGFSLTPLLSNGYDVRLLIWRLRVRVPPGVLGFFFSMPRVLKFVVLYYRNNCKC